MEQSGLAEKMSLIEFINDYYLLIKNDYRLEKIENVTKLLYFKTKIKQHLELIKKNKGLNHNIIDDIESFVNSLFRKDLTEFDFVLEKIENVYEFLDYYLEYEKKLSKSKHNPVKFNLDKIQSFIKTLIEQRKNDDLEKINQKIEKIINILIKLDDISENISVLKNELFLNSNDIEFVINKLIYDDFNDDKFSYIYNKISQIDDYLNVLLDSFDIRKESNYLYCFSQ